MTGVRDLTTVRELQEEIERLKIRQELDESEIKILNRRIKMLLDRVGKAFIVANGMLAPSVYKMFVVKMDEKKGTE